MEQQVEAALHRLHSADDIDGVTTDQADADENAYSNETRSSARRALRRPARR